MNIPKALNHCLDDENKSFGAKALPVYTGKENCLGAKALQVYTGKPNDYSGSSCVIMNNYFTADYSVLQKLDTDLRMDCFHFMNYIREKTTTDVGHFIYGCENTNTRIYATYFSKMLHVQFKQSGLWNFVLNFDIENQNFNDSYLLHAWTVAIKDDEIKIYMTHAAEQEIIKNIYFQDIYKHVNYDEWMRNIVEMVKYVQQNGFDDRACFMYECCFSIKIPTMKRNSLNLYWKCYDWK